jgi:hypothetical protein
MSIAESRPFNLIIVHQDNWLCALAHLVGSSTVGGGTVVGGVIGNEVGKDKKTTW